MILKNLKEKILYACLNFLSLLILILVYINK